MDTSDDSKRVIADSIRHLIFHCGSLKSGERVTILSDPKTRLLADQFEDVAMEQAGRVEHYVIEGLTRHGQEPPDEAASLMAASDLIISLCTWSLAHSMARIDAGKKGARFLSLPYYSEALLSDPCIRINYRDQKRSVQQLSDVLTEGEWLHIQSETGTDIRLNIKGRIGNACPGIVELPGELGSPPDVESNISPLETESEGIVCIDGSITCDEIGLLKTPVWLKVEKGLITKISGKDEKVIKILETMLGPPGSPRRVLAECGIGLNPLAKLTGTMLTDEGSMGSVHFGFGSNSTVGGINDIDFHLDFVFRNPTMYVNSSILLERGELKI